MVSFLDQHKNIFEIDGTPNVGLLRTHILQSLFALLSLQTEDGTLNNAESRVFSYAVKTLCNGIAKTIPLDEEYTENGMKNWMPLHWAALMGTKCSVEDFNEIAIDYRGDLASGRNVMSPVHCAVSSEDPNVEVLESMLMSNPKIFDEKDKDGCLPLHYAVRLSDNIDLLEYVIQRNPSATKTISTAPETSNVQSGTPLFQIFMRSRPSTLAFSIFECLLKADPTSIDIPDNDGNNILHIAMLYLDLHDVGKIITEILRRNPDAASRFSPKTFGIPLHTLCVQTFPETLGVIKQILQVYPQGIFTRSLLRRHYDGVLPIEAALFDGADFSVIQHLLHSENSESAQAADTNKHSKGLTPMHFVSKTGKYKKLRSMELAGDQSLPGPLVNVQIVQLLHDANNNWVQTPDIVGAFPLHFACEYGNHSLVSPLIALYPEAARIKNKAGYLPIHELDLWETDTDFTSEEIETIKSLVVTHPESAHVMHPSLHSCPFKLVFDRALITRSETCNDLLRFIIRQGPDYSSNILLHTLNYDSRKHNIMKLLFTFADARDMHPLVVQLRQLRSSKRGGTNILSHITSFL